MIKDMSTGPTGVDGLQGPQGTVTISQRGPTGLTGPQGSQPTPFGQRVYTAYSSTTPITLAYADVNTILTIKYFPDISNTNLVVTLPTTTVNPGALYNWFGPWMIINYVVTSYSPNVSPVGGITFTQPVTWSGGTNTITTTDKVGQVVVFYHAAKGGWFMTINSNRASVRSAQGINQVDMAPLVYSGGYAPSTLSATLAVSNNYASASNFVLTFYNNTINSVVGGSTMMSTSPVFTNASSLYSYTPSTMTAGYYYYMGLSLPTSTIPVYSNMSQMPGGLVTNITMGTFGSYTFNSGLASYPGSGYYLSCKFQVDLAGTVIVKYYQVNGSGTTLLSTSTFTAPQAIGGTYAYDSGASYPISSMTSGYFYYATVKTVGRAIVTGTSVVCNLTSVSVNGPGFPFKGYQPGVYPDSSSTYVYNFWSSYNITVSNVPCIKLVLLLWYNPNKYSIYHYAPNQQFYYYYRGGTCTVTLTGTLSGGYSGTCYTSWLCCGPYDNDHEYGFPFGWQVQSYDYNDNVIATYNISGYYAVNFSILNG